MIILLDFWTELLVHTTLGVERNRLWSRLDAAQTPSFLNRIIHLWAQYPLPFLATLQVPP